jgi:hypothetical protein
MKEGPWDDVMRIIGQAHSLLHGSGVVRIQTDIRVGSRTDKKQTIEDKIAVVEALLNGQNSDGEDIEGLDPDSTTLQDSQLHDPSLSSIHNSVSAGNSMHQPNLDRASLLANHPYGPPPTANMHSLSQNYSSGLPTHSHHGNNLMGQNMRSN